MEKFIHPAPTEWGEDSIFGCPLAKCEFNIFEVKNQPLSFPKLQDNYKLCSSRKISSFCIFIFIFYYCVSIYALLFKVYFPLLRANFNSILGFRVLNEFY